MTRHREAARALRIVSTASLALLLVLALAWELWLAPLRPGGSWLALKALPLALALPGLALGLRYTAQWASMLSLAYFVEGVMRGWGDRGLSQQLAWLEIALSLVLFATCVAYARLQRPAPD